MNIPHDCVLPSALSSAVLLGLTSSKTVIKEYASYCLGEHTYKVLKRTLPNNLARVDLILVNNEPAGTIVSIRISPRLFHITGVYIKEAFRGQNLLARASVEISPAQYLMKRYKNDVTKIKEAISLEVMNYNTAAIRLYTSSKKECNNASVSEFIPLRPYQIGKYGTLRNKKVKRWVKVNVNPEVIGVQWRNVKDHGKTFKWSIARIYTFNANASGEHVLENEKPYSRTLLRIRLLYSLIVYSSFSELFLFLKSKFTSLKKNT